MVGVSVSDEDLGEFRRVQAFGTHALENPLGPPNGRDTCVEQPQFVSLVHHEHVAGKSPPQHIGKGLVLRIPVQIVRESRNSFLALVYLGEGKKLRK